MTDFEVYVWESFKEAVIRKVENEMYMGVRKELAKLAEIKERLDPDEQKTMGIYRLEKDWHAAHDYHRTSGDERENRFARKLVYQAVEALLERM